MREGPICRCPECRDGDIFELDEKLYTCTNCHRVWDLEEMYKTLWLDKLQRLIERRQALKKPSASSNHLDRRIQQMRDDIMDIELLLNALEDKLLAEYCGAAEPPARWWRSHLSGLLEPPRLSTGYLAFSGSNP